MKLIFLDFDDVLNDAHTPNVEHNVPWLASKLRRGLDPKKVALVNQVMELAGGKDVVKFVASTSWRRFYGGDELQRLLNEKGFKGEIVDQTPLKMSYLDRLAEISLWFDLGTERGASEVPLPDYFLILDDKPIRGPLKAHHVQTEEDVGLTPAHVQRCLRILTTPAAPTYAKIRAKFQAEEKEMDAMLDRLAERAKKRAAEQEEALKFLIIPEPVLSKKRGR